MAILRVCLAVLLTLLPGVAEVRAADPQAQAGLFDRPVLVVDPGMHTAQIKSGSADQDGRWAVTGSDDKTIRVWSLTDGSLAGTIRLPQGQGNIGKVYAVAISPDGGLIAAGGWTRATEADPQQQLYVFDRATGALVRRIEGLPSVVHHLAFSPDGTRLAAVISRGNGLRIYAKQTGWAEEARDADYGGDSYGVDFALDGTLATTAYDGKVRLYADGLHGAVRPKHVIQTPGGVRPYGIAFSPDGTRLALGYEDTGQVDLLDGHTLTPLGRPDLTGIDNGELATVAWSRDGATLFAAGSYLSGAGAALLSWGDGGTGGRRFLPAGTNTVRSLVPLPGGDVLVAASDPWVGRLAPDGTKRWLHGSPAADFGDQESRLSVSADGAHIGFGFQHDGASPAQLDLTSRTLTRTAEADPSLAVPRQTGLPIENWNSQTNPALGGKALTLDKYETSQSLAIHRNGDRFVLGTDWSLRAFDAQGTPLWRRDVPGTAWAVNITGDGRLVVAAYGDGTIRWHRMTDGLELLAFLPLADQTNWVAWTPEGFYAATAGARGVLRWHINHGWDPADSVAVAEIPGFYRPEILPHVLQQLETERAIGVAEVAEQKRRVMIRLNSSVPPGARLHLLAIGISAYNEAAATSLRLKYAGRDANDLASAIFNTQGSLYTVVPHLLVDKDANKLGIMRALAQIRADMEKGGGNDLAVVQFAGHGAMVDGKLYLLPQEVDARDEAGLKATGLSADDLRGELLELGKHGRVLVLLDACHSGATTMTGRRIDVNADALRTGLAAANVTVLTSSKGSETSEEREEWQHGAFTKVLLDALSDPEADMNRNHLISTTGLETYVNRHVPMLTEGKQHPGMEVRFDTTLFVSGS